MKIFVYFGLVRAVAFNINCTTTQLLRNTIQLKTPSQLKVDEEIKYIVPQVALLAGIRVFTYSGLSRVIVSAK